MRGRVAITFERLGIAISQQAKISVFFKRPSNVNEIAISFGHQRSIGQALANRFGDLECGRPLGDFFHGPVGKLDVNALCHRFGSEWSVFSLLEGSEWVKLDAGRG